MAKRLCIIPCGKRKVWDKYPALSSVDAEKAYIGIFHKLCQKYARTFFDTWVILSAKHGWLLPEDEVPGNYDLTFNLKGESGISKEKLLEQAISKNILHIDEVVVLGGKKFQPIVNFVFKDIKVTFPLKGCRGIGEMQQQLKSAIMMKKEI
ncbi:DUF6884 domain-containing protein [Metabacillus arenae]|uniref:DUF6884 domain-containing protein n=1 Tax=Metabacillus arenae TaxID=2771434 RepID=A0A926NP53_9BACI|nr:DUF6884 domain-containing protein [Metabacillus arenae]MBD1381366.1 hypothetical protein [Metabacillus arenae]